MRPTHLFAVLAVTALSLSTAAPALAADKGDQDPRPGHRDSVSDHRHADRGRASDRVHVQVDEMSCVGDTVSGTVTGQGPSGTVLTARLRGLGASRAGGSRPTRGSVSTTVTMPLPAGGKAVHFDVAAMTAQVYQVVMLVGETRVAASQAVPADSCAPGHEVPEAPTALLAPLTMLGAAALAGRRRLRPRHAAA